MSGGAWDYKQYHIADIAERIEEYINGRELDEVEVESYISDHCFEDEEIDYIRKHNRTIPNQYWYSEETINELRKGIECLHKAFVYAHHID